MAKSVSFALILTKNTAKGNKKSILKLPQIEAEITVSQGMDPYTLQEMRDKIAPSFMARRDALNKIIEASEKQLFKEKNQKKRKALLAAKLKQIDQVVQKFETNLTKRVNDFCEEQAKEVAEFEKEQVKFAVSCAWSFGNVLKDAVEGISDMFAANTLPTATLAGAKAIADLALDIKGLVGDLRDAYKSGAQVHADIIADLKKIKAIKPPKTVGNSLVKNLGKNIELYEGKMTSAEMQAKALARKVDGFLKFAAKRKGELSKEASALVADVVQKTIKEVQRIATDLKKAQRSLQSFKDKHANAEKVAKKDAASFVTWAISAYDMANKIYGWYADFGDIDKAIDVLVTFTTSDDFFEPLKVDF